MEVRSIHIYVSCLDDTLGVALKHFHMGPVAKSKGFYAAVILSCYFLRKKHIRDKPIGNYPCYSMVSRKKAYENVLKVFLDSEFPRLPTDYHRVGKIKTPPVGRGWNTYFGGPCLEPIFDISIVGRNIRKEKAFGLQTTFPTFPRIPRLDPVRDEKYGILRTVIVTRPPRVKRKGK